MLFNWDTDNLVDYSSHLLGLTLGDQFTANFIRSISDEFYKEMGSILKLNVATIDNHGFDQMNWIPSELHPLCCCMKSSFCWVCLSVKIWKLKGYVVDGPRRWQSVLIKTNGIIVQRWKCCTLDSEQKDKQLLLIFEWWTKCSYIG